MAKIIYIEHDGTEHIVDVANGSSLMEGARDNNIPGIVADCGGACACATCHVYVDAQWMDKISGREETEQEMLDFTAAPASETSRLACQITIASELDGLIVRMPETQD